MKSKVMHILIPEGNPNGMKIIEIPGWSGKCFAVPRQNLKELQNRSEINQPGLYLLFGTDELSSETLAYIGESENFYNRITNHDSNKDFWDNAIIFSGGLNKAFVKYLEYKAITTAHNANRVTVQNKIQPQENTLSESEKVIIEHYFENTQFILSALGYEIFESINEAITDKKIYHLKGTHVNAKAQLLSDGSLNVMKGSLARIKETDSFIGWSQATRQKYIDDGTFIQNEDGTSYLYTRDILYKSPSAAASTTMGTAVNGWIVWKDASGATLDENLRN